MAYCNIFTNLNRTLSRFNNCLGGFTMPNFFSNMTFFNLNNFSYTAGIQQCFNFGTQNPFSVFDSTMSFSPPPTNFINSINTFNIGNSWQNSHTMPNFDSFSSFSSWQMPYQMVGFDTFSFGNTTGSFATNKKQERQYGSLQEKYYKTALSFVGNINTDKAGNKRFSNNRSNQWCADFASTLAHEVFGEKLPAGFPDARKHSVSTMSIKAWAERKDINRYLDLPSSNIGQFIAQNVKPGDIMIISRGGGAGHTAIVTAVNSDGTFETVEGNIGGTSSNGGGKVGTKTRQPKAHQSNGATLIGFVQMGDIA